jgi:transposase
MAARDGSVHVATTRRHYKGKTYESHLLRRTFREDGKVKHETLGNISHLPSALVDIVRRGLRGETFVAASEALEIVRSLPHGHVAAVLGTLRKIGLQQTLDPMPSPMRNLIEAMIVSRILAPGSKLATARGVRIETAVSTLGEQLGLETITEDKFYAALDWLLDRQQTIEGVLAKKHLEDGTMVLYDTSSSYYTGTHCSLAKMGYSRDRKTGFPQINYGLLCNRDGCPIAVEVFEGNTGDPKTLTIQIEKLRERFRLERIVLVGDRGTLTEARIREELRDVPGLDWISALRSPAIRKLVDQEVLQPSLFDKRDLAEITSPDYPDERLIACYNPLLAAERKRNRRGLLEATEVRLDKIGAATQREKRPLRGKDKIGVRAGKVLNRHKVGKHFQLTITDTTLSYRRRPERVEAEAALDGIYVIRTSVGRKDLKAPEAVRAYKRLSVVERAFRCLKTVDLKVRPIYHRLEGRVRAHVFLCMLAYYVEWHMREALAPILFDDEDSEGAEAMRASVVAPARRSPSAARKAAAKRTQDDLPVHSFRTLLQDLATIARHRVRPRSVNSDSGVTFQQVTIPTPVQHRALDLLGVGLTL